MFVLAHPKRSEMGVPLPVFLQISKMTEFETKFTLVPKKLKEIRANIHGRLSPSIMRKLLSNFEFRISIFRRRAPSNLHYCCPLRLACRPEPTAFSFNKNVYP